MWGYPGVGEVQNSWLGLLLFCADVWQPGGVEFPADCAVSDGGNPDGGLSRDDVIMTSSLVESARAGATRRPAEVGRSSDESRNRIHRFFLLCHTNHIRPVVPSVLIKPEKYAYF